MSKKQTYTVLDDSKVVAIWRCPDCGEEVEVSPTFYGESGTPICSGVGNGDGTTCSGGDMEYVETRLLN